VLKTAINITINKQALLLRRVLLAWAMKFNRKYVGPIHHTKRGVGGEFVSCRVFSEGGGGVPG